MRKHTMSLFALTNLHNHDFSYCLAETNLQKLDGKEDLYNRQMLKVAQKIASLTLGPAVPVHIKGKLFIAVPADTSFEPCKVNIVPSPVAIKLLPEIYHTSVNDNTDQAKNIILKFLNFGIGKSLSRDSSLWKLNSDEFFQRRPIRSDAELNVEVFGGFDYKVVRLEDGQFYVALDITYKYISKEYLSKQVTIGNVKLIGQRFKGRRFLYQNGDSWYTIELEGFARKISEQEFLQDGISHNLLDYIQKKSRQTRLHVSPSISADDVSILYKYPGRNMQPHSGASSLAKMIYQTNDGAVKDLHRFSIKIPDSRFELIYKVIGTFFQNLRFNEKPLLVSMLASTERVNVFPMPELLYNNERILKVGHYTTGASAPLKCFGQERMQHMLDNGVLNGSTFDSQFLLVPDSLDKSLVAAIQNNIEHSIRKLAPAFTRFKVIRYHVSPHKAATYQVQEIEKILKNQGAINGFALFILPDIAVRSKQSITVLHDCLKSKFYPDLKVQCASNFKIQRFFQASTSASGEIEYRVPEQLKSKFRSYVTYLVMEHLIMNRKWPYALANNLHYDVYIGIDVHNRHAGFTFFFKNGQHIFFTSEPVPKKNRSQRAEKLSASLLCKVMYEKLKSLIPQYAPNPNGIVIIRDGRSFGEEEKALDTLIETLAKDNIVDLNLQKGVVDLHKQSAIPFRMAYQTNGHTPLDNPAAGAYKLFDSKKEGFLFNTGFPFSIPGTAKPLHLSLQSGNLDFIKVLEDVFHQSMLAFSAPDRSNSLPITIKLIDTMLEPLAALSDEMEEEDELIEAITEY